VSLVRSWAACSAASKNDRDYEYLLERQCEMQGRQFISRQYDAALTYVDSHRYTISPASIQTTRADSTELPIHPDQELVTSQRFLRLGRNFCSGRAPALPSSEFTLMTYEPPASETHVCLSDRQVFRFTCHTMFLSMNSRRLRPFLIRSVPGCEAIDDAARWP
jgi:hypothetical protein